LLVRRRHNHTGGGQLADEVLVHRATHATGKRRRRRRLVDVELNTVLKLLLVIIELQRH